MMQQVIVAPVTLDTFLELKLAWGVAIQALIVRAHVLGLITPRRYKSLMQRVAMRGWRTNEPLSSQVPLERPRAVRQIAELIYGQRINYGKLATDAGYPEFFVRELIEAHASKPKDKATSAPSDVDPQSSAVLPFTKKGGTTL